MLLDLLKKSLIEAQKAKQETTVSILRFLLAQITNARIAKGADLSDDEIVREIQKEVKRHQESITAFTTGGREDLAQKEKDELVILMTFLPEQMGEDEVAALVEATITETGATSIRDMGKVMGAMQAKVQGKADNSLISRLVKERLAEKN